MSKILGLTKLGLIFTIDNSTNRDSDSQKFWIFWNFRSFRSNNSSTENQCWRISVNNTRILRARFENEQLYQLDCYTTTWILEMQPHQLLSSSLRDCVDIGSFQTFLLINKEKSNLISVLYGVTTNQLVVIVHLWNALVSKKDRASELVV